MAETIEDPRYVSCKEDSCKIRDTVPGPPPDDELENSGEPVHVQGDALSEKSRTTIGKSVGRNKLVFSAYLDPDKSICQKNDDNELNCYSLRGVMR